MSSYTIAANPEPEEFYSFERVLDYLEGKLSPGDQSRLEVALSLDEELEDYVDEVHDAWLRNPNLREDTRRESSLLMATFTRLAEEQSLPASKPPKTANWKPSAIAATVLIAVVLTWWAYSPSGTCHLSTPDLIANTGAYGQMATTQSQGMADGYSEAFGYYAEGDYRQAIPLFERLTQATPPGETLREMTLSLGVAYLMTGQSQAAVPYLQSARGFFQPRYQQEGAWYLALAYRDLGRTAEAQALLRDLADRGQLHADHARALMACSAP